MGNLLIGILVALVVFNAIRAVYGLNQRMKGDGCTGQCSTCKRPCQVKRIYGRAEAESLTIDRETTEKSIEKDGKT